MAVPTSRHALLDRLQIRLPIIQAPMAGVASPAMAAAVSNAGGLGSLGIGAADAATARQMIGTMRERSRGALNVNVFCHAPARHDVPLERAWLEQLRPEFARFGARLPAKLEEIYLSFRADAAMQEMLLAVRPEIVSFHFGLPSEATLQALRAARIILLATATSLREACVLEAAGIDAVIAQGYEAGGHRGLFDPDAPDDRLGTLALTRLLVRRLQVPVIAAGGIMDGAGVAAALALGAAAAQLGTAFLCCAESQADEGYRAALRSEAAWHTVMTQAISGRPARCLANRFTHLGAAIAAERIPAYPIAYDAAKALHGAARTRGEFGYGPQWAGQGAPLCREGSASEIMLMLEEELAAARRANLA